MISAAALARQAYRTARWPAIVLGCATPISVALDNALRVLALTGRLVFGGLLIDHAEGLLCASANGLLFAGLTSPQHPGVSKL